MCMACIEYIKGTLKLNEFKSALRETAEYGDKEHAEKLQAIIYDHDGDEDGLKAKLNKNSGS
jgi:hypothetical protein